MFTHISKQSNDVSIIIPYIRPKGFNRLVESLFYCIKDINFEIVAEEDKDRIGVPKMVKHLLNLTKYDLVLFLADDVICTEGFLNKAIDTMNEFDESYGLVGLNDNFHVYKPATHFLIHKKLIPLIGDDIFHTGYIHCFCDLELCERAEELNRYKWCKEAVIIHDHPIINKQPLYGDYKRVYNLSYYMKDSKLYKKRKGNGWK